MDIKNNSDSAEDEVKKWLQVALAKENLENLSVDLAGNSEKGDGYIGEIAFVVASGMNKFGEKKIYNLVLKCSKASASLMKAFPIRETFIREMYVYEKIFPTFRKFQIERGIEKPFDSVPKCYGTYNDGFRYVVVLENLKKSDYDLWKNGTPLTRRHIDLIVAEYAKFHAISVAVKEKEPENFQRLIDGLKEDIVRKIFEGTDFITPSQTTIEEIGELFKDELSEDKLNRWLSFKDRLPYLRDLTPDTEDLHVILHGDCWNNNFLHKHEDDARSIPSKVAMLDWQLSRYSSPIFDLSYFLFSCISEKDIFDVDTILRTYYESLCENVTKMGSKSLEGYPVEKLLEEWGKYSQLGLWWCQLTMKAAFSSKEDLPDMAQSAENGDFDNAFTFGIRDKIGCRNRFRHIVQFAIETGLV